MKASVIIPAWNGREYLPSCLDALLAQGYPDLEVIVVDNASTDGSADLVAEQYPQVHLIRSQSNLGFAGGCNVGLRAARGDVLILLNQDARVSPGWLQALVDALRRPGVDIVGCKSLYPDGETIQHAGGWIEWPLGLPHHYGRGERDDGRWDEPRQVDYVTGAAMGFRCDLLERVGLLDEDFWPGYFEDTDFCFRAREAGYEVWYIPNSMLVHTEATSIKDPRKFSYFNERGRLRFVLKHLPPQRFLKEFVPAEKERHSPFAQEPGGDTLRLAYLEAIPMAARILPQRWHTDERTVEAVLLALQSLYFTISEASIDIEDAEFPSLQEFEFRSAVPVIGPFIAWFRRACYNIAARWAVRYLIQQQTIINRQQAVMMHSLERHLTESNVSLAYEVARLIRRLETLQQRIGRPEDNG